MDGAKRSFCLRRKTAGRSEVLRLETGSNRIGSQPSNRVVLSESGVSRHQTVIEIAGGSLSLEDLASKNGTFVNGERVRRRELAVGDVLAFGDSRFRLEEMEDEEAVLAIDLGTGPEPGSGWTRETTRIAAAEGSSELVVAMRATEALVHRLCRRDGADLRGALAVLYEVLNAGAAWVLERPSERRAVFLATCGPVEDGATARVAERFLAAAETLASEPEMRRGEPFPGVRHRGCRQRGYRHRSCRRPGVGCWSTRRCPLSACGFPGRDPGKAPTPCCAALSA